MGTVAIITGLALMAFLFYKWRVTSKELYRQKMLQVFTDNQYKSQVENLKRDLTTSKEKYFTFYNAGFNHGANQGPFPEIGIAEAYDRMLKGESPLNDGTRYSLK